MEALQDKVAGDTVSWKMMVATIAGTDGGGGGGDEPSPSRVSSNLQCISFL